jgi:hypothetical protein
MDLDNDFPTIFQAQAENHSLAHMIKQALGKCRTQFI